MKCRKKRIKYLITDLNMTADVRCWRTLYASVGKEFFSDIDIYMYVLHTRITEKYKGRRGAGDKLFSFIVGHLWVRAPSKDPIVSSSKKLPSLLSTGWFQNRFKWIYISNSCLFHNQTKKNDIIYGIRKSAWWVFHLLCSTT